jgi:predicted GTPase
MSEKVIIMGAAGRDFHNFNVYFRDNQRYEVVAFTAAQIPDIEGRQYPPELAGKLYPHGIPIYHEDELVSLIRKHQVDLAAFCYSDIPHVDVMRKASTALAHGADFILMGATYTMLKSSKPVISVCAVRTGCGKSQTTRKVCEIITQQGKKVVAVRHPMPYGDLKAQVVQRFSCYEDFAQHKCTIEEREEYEPLVDQGIIVYAGVDYGEILRDAQKEAEVIVWDGGNNDTPFYEPNVSIVLFDPHRAGHELGYYPGTTNMLMADIAVINKVDTATPIKINEVRNNIANHAPQAQVVLAESTVKVNHPEHIKGKRVLVVEDGPTLTHGEMTFGAGMIAAQQYQAGEIIDPRPYAVGSIKQTYERYQHIDEVLPAMGYNPDQIRELEQTINNAECDLVLFGTPIQLTRIVHVNKPMIRVRYEYTDHSSPTLEQVLLEKLKGVI